MDELMVKDNGISNDLDDAKNNILVKIQGTLLGAGVAGIYQQKADGSTVMAVLPEKDSTVEPMTLDGLIDQLKNIPGVTVDTDSMKASIHSVAGDLEVSLTLKEIYYYYKKEAEDKETTEYAFEIEITAENLNLPGLELKSAAVAIWNTEKEQELERMGIADLLKMVENP